jgi:hypothetical protein
MAPKLSLAALAIALAAPAFADPIADFKTGTVVATRTVTVNDGGSIWSTSDVAVKKLAGSLDLAIDAVDLGIPVKLVIHLRGSALANGRIAYTIDEVYSPAVDLGNGQKLTRIYGKATAAASWLHGTARPEIGNVNVELVDAGSYLALEIDGRTQTIPILRLDLVGGVVQPPLGTFSDSGARRITCSDAVRTKHTLAVSLTDVARANGAPVELKSPLRSGVRVPSIVMVAAGSRTAYLTAVVEPNFVGTVRVTAAAGGIARSLDLVIHARRDCL